MTDSTYTSEPVRLPLIGVWRAALRALWVHRWLAVGLAVVNQIAASLLDGLDYALWEWIAALPSTPAAVAGMAIATAGLALYAILALAWMRVCLLGSQFLRGHLGMPLDRTTASVVNAMLVGLLLLGIAAGAIYVVGYHARWFPAAAVLVVAVLTAPPLLARWSLVLPALAAGHRTNFHLALAQSRGNGLRLAIVLFVGVAFVIAGVMLALAIYDSTFPELEILPGAPPAETVDFLFYGMLWLVLVSPPLLMAAGSLAYAYRVLSSHPDPLAVTD